MELQGERQIAAAPSVTWAALNDANVLKACIVGCSAFDRIAEHEFKTTMAVRLGPVSARLNGRVKLENVVPPVSCTIRFDGQGGMAGFGSGSADVRLSPRGSGTCLVYTAKAQVGGKLAQVGSRLIEGTAAKMADEFFTAFEHQVSPPVEELQRPACLQPGQRTRVRIQRVLIWIAAATAAAIVIAYLAK